MFLLIDPDERREMRFGDLVVSYHEAPGDVCLEAITRVPRDAVTGKPTEPQSTPGFLAPFVVDWSGVGDRSGAPIPWPAVGVRGPALSPADRALRERLLGLLPWNVLLKLDAGVTRTWQEGAASGKD